MKKQNTLLKVVRKHNTIEFLCKSKEDFDDAISALKNLLEYKERQRELENQTATLN